MSNQNCEYKLPESRFGLGSDHTENIIFLIKYFRIVCMVFVVWIIGYWNFSIAWILLAVFLYLLREKQNSARNMKANMIKAIGINEKDAILARLDEVPGWVYFPDKERVEWLNKFLKQIWPNLRVYITKTLVESIERIINEYSIPLIETVKFNEIDLGEVPPRIASVKVYTENVPQGEILLDVELLYAGDAMVKMTAKKILAGVKDIQVIDFNLTEVANTFDMPGLRKLIDNTIQDAVSKTLVLPNRLVIPIFSDFDVSELDSLKSLRPKGVLRIHVKRGINLKNADINILGRGKSDPYVKISGIGVDKLTRVIDDNLDPVWNETFNYMIDEANLIPNLRIECFDKDEINDDFLGGLDINVESIKTKGKEEGNYKLKDVKQGELNLKFEWFNLTTNREKLNETRKLKSFIQQATCLLLVDLKSATDLPSTYKKSGGLSEPNPKVILLVDEKETRTSAIKQNATNPVWNENHYFFVENPDVERLVCKVQDEKTKSSVGSFEFSIKELFNEENLTVDRSFNLNTFKTGSNGLIPKIHLKLSLLILCPNKEDNEILENQMTSSRSENLLTIPDLNLDEVRTSEASSFRDIEKISVASNSHGSRPCGKIRISMKYRLEEAIFIVNIHECRNLIMLNGSKKPDPYVRIQLLPDKKSKKVTRSIKDTIDPVFDERIQWHITLKDLKQRELCIIIKNDAFILSKEKHSLGQLVLDLSSVENDVLIEKWYDLRARTKSKFFIDHIETMFDKITPT